MNRSRDRRKALAAKVRPLARLLVAAERLWPSMERGGPPLTTSELTEIMDTFKRLDFAAELAAGFSIQELCLALVSWAQLCARWPTATSLSEVATVHSVQGTAVGLLWQLLPSPSLPPAHSCTTIWAWALLRGDFLYCLSRRLQSQTEVVLRSLAYPCAGSTGADGEREGGSSTSSNSLSESTEADLFGLGYALTHSMHTVTGLFLAGMESSLSGADSLPQQLLEAVRSSYVLEHVARGMAVLTMHRGAAVARGEVGDSIAYEGIQHSNYVVTLHCTSATYTNGDQNRLQQQQQQPPSEPDVDPKLCGPWSRHLQLAWGLHHLHALDGGGHCGLHPDMVRGLPPAAGPQAAGPSTSGGPGASGAAAAARAGMEAGAGSSAPRVLNATALWRLVHLLRWHNQGLAFPTSGLKLWSKGLMDLSVQRSDIACSIALLKRQRRAHGGAALAGVDAEVARCTERLKVLDATFQQLAAACCGVGPLGGVTGGAPSGTPACDTGGNGDGQSEASDPTGQVSSSGTARPRVLVPQAVVRHVAARLVRAAAASARVWQREEGRGGGGEEGRGVGARQEREGRQGRAGGAAEGGGEREEAAGASAAGQPLVLGREDAVPLAAVGLMMYQESVMALEARMRGRQQAVGAGGARAAAGEGAAGGAAAGAAEGGAEEAAAGTASAAGQGAREAGRRGCPVSVRLWTEMYRLWFEAVLAVMPLEDESIAQTFAKGLRLCLRELPPAGSLPPLPPPRLSAALRAGYLPSLERLVRRCGREGALPDLRVLTQLLGPWEGAEAECKSGPHDLLWLLAYGDRDQAGALVSSLGKVLAGVFRKAYGTGQHPGGSLVPEGSLVPGPEAQRRMQPGCDLHMGAVALLRLGMEWCESAAAASFSGIGAGGGGTGVQQERGVQEQEGGRVEEQLVLMVSHMVHAWGEHLCDWLREMCCQLRALMLPVGGAGVEDATGSCRGSIQQLLGQVGKALPVVLRVMLVTARTALQTDGVAGAEVGNTVPDSSAGGSSTPASLRTGGPMGRWCAALEDWLVFLPSLPPQDQPGVARLGVDLAWCLAALGAAGEGAEVGFSVVESEAMDGVLRVARTARDAETVRKAEAYLDWARKGGSSGAGSSSDRGVGGGEAGRVEGVMGGVPESCLRLEGGAPWLLSAEEVRRRLPRSYWNGACERREGDSEAGAG